MNSTTGKPPETDMRSFQGKVLDGRYKLAEYIAEGNFGAVFRSEQMLLGHPARRVAVKLSKQTGIEPAEAREMFADVFVLAQAMDDMRDATARSRLVHVYDAGVARETDQRAFVVMEYVHGTTLQAQFEAREQVSAAQLLKWARQIAEAIGGLHQLVKPLIHRDIKPDNILLGMDRAVRVVDFGLTARLNDQGRVPGKAGTFQYMAPETACGSSQPASDIYSIGLILYEGLTGRLPFDHLVPPLDWPTKKQNEWLYQQKQTLIIDPPSGSNRSVSSKLDQLVLRCLKFNPDERYRDGAALLTALDQLENPEPLSVEVAALAEAHQRRAVGDLAGSIAACKKGLEVAQPQRETHLDLLTLLAELQAQIGVPAEAAQSLTRLWKMVRSSGDLLPQAAQRAELLDRLCDLFRLAGNPYQANTFTLERNRLFPNVPPTRSSSGSVAGG